jgi:hypothetical protein
MSIANLKVVGGTGFTRTAPPIDFDSHTNTDVLNIDRLVGQENIPVGKSKNLYWRDYAEYQQNIKSVWRVSKVFFDCLSKWKEETELSSSMTDIILHPSYQRIIGLGPDAVPFVLQELEANGGLWFWALQALTGEDPVPEEDRGRIKRMTTAWLDWGRSHQLL